MTVLIKYPSITKKRMKDFLDRRGEEFTNLFWANMGGTFDTDGTISKCRGGGSGIQKICRIAIKDRGPVEFFCRKLETSLTYIEHETKAPKSSYASSGKKYTAKEYVGGMRSFKAIWFVENVYPYLLKQEKKDYAAKLLGYRPESKPFAGWTPEEIKHYFGTATEGDGSCYFGKKGATLGLQIGLYSKDLTYLSTVKNLIDKVGVVSSVNKSHKVYMTQEGPAQMYMMSFWASTSANGKHPANVDFAQSLLERDVMTLDRKKCKIQEFVRQFEKKH